jgi:hypothetical protein
VGVGACLTGLVASLERLEEALTGLRFTVVEDEPTEDHALVTELGYAVEDLAGSLQEAVQAVRDGNRAFVDRNDVDRARRGLEAAHERFNELTYKLWSGLLAYDRVALLMTLGRERGRQWQSWARMVKQGLDECQEQVHDVNAALLRCWKEMGERLGMTSVSVQATNIGQQLTVPEAELAREGFT